MAAPPELNVLATKGLGGLFEALPPLDVGDANEAHYHDASRHDSVDARFPDASVEVNLSGRESMPSTTKSQAQQMLQHFHPMSHLPPGTVFAIPAVLTPTGSSGPVTLLGPGTANLPQPAQLSSSHDSVKSGTPTGEASRNRRAMLARDPVAAAVFNARRAPPTMKSIFVSGLHEKTEFTDLEAIFSTFGELISCRVLRDAKTGMSRRIGYVNFTTAEAAMAALHALDSKAGPHGAPFVLQFADDDPSFKPEPTKRLFVRFIPIECSEQRIRDLFGQFGDITELTLSRDLCRAAKKEPQPWNMAYISYTRTEDATKAIASTDRQYLLSETHHLVVKAAENPATKHKRLEWRAQAQAAMPPPPVTTSPPVVGLSKAPPPYGAPVPPAYQQYAPQATNVFSLPAQLSQSSTPSVPSPQNMQNPQPQQWFAVQYPQQHAPQQHAQAPQMSPPGAPPQFVYRQQMPAVIEVPFTPPGNAMPQPPPGAHGLWPAPGPQQQGAPQPRIVVPQPAGAPQLAPQMVPQPQFHPTYQHQPWNRAPPSPSHQMGAPTTLTQLPAFASPPTPHGYQPVEAFGAPYSHTSGHFSVSTNNTQPPTPSGHVVMFDAQRQAGSPHAPPPTATGAPPQQLYMRTPDGQFVPVQSFGPRQQR